MKIHKSKITNLTNKATQKKLNNLLNSKKVNVFPFILCLGTTNVTNNGERSWNAQINDYNTFITVLNGKENAIAVWENSTRAYKDELSELSPMNGYKGEYKVGKYYAGYVVDDKMGSEISQLVGDEQFKTLKQVQEITIVFDKSCAPYLNIEYPWNISPQDLLKLYVIPELFGYSWLRITNVQKYYNTDKKKTLSRVEVTFKSINDALSDTGGVKRQFINYSSPGEEYAFPLVVNGEVQLDPTRLLPTPVTSIQIRCDGVAGLSSFYAMGRPVFRDSNGEKRVLPPRRILPENMKGYIISPLSLLGTATDNYYYVKKAEMELSEFYKDWKEKIGDTYNMLQTQNFEGAVQLGTNEEVTAIEATNPLGTGGTYQKKIKDNPKIPINESYPCGTAAMVQLNGDIPRFIMKDNYTVAEILCHNGFINDQVLRLRNTIKNVTTWSLSKIPVVGGFLNGIVAGADYGWADSKVSLPTPPFGFFLPCELLALAKLKGSNQMNGLAPDFFRSGTESDITQKAGIGNINTSFRFTITDVYRDYNDGNKLKQTLYLGQSKNELGEDIPIQKWNPKCSPEPRNSMSTMRGDIEGYIIDYEVIKMLYAGDYTVSFYNDNTGEAISIAEWRLVSKAKTSNSIREWTNEFKMSYWTDNFTTNDKFIWPQAVQPPPVSGISPNVDITMNIEALIGAQQSDWRYLDKDRKDFNYIATEEWKNNVGEENIYTYSGSGVNADWQHIYYLDKGGFKAFGLEKPVIKDGTIILDKSEITKAYNASVEYQYQISNLEMLRNEFKRVEITIENIYQGNPVYQSPGTNDSLRTYSFTMDEFLGNSTKTIWRSQPITDMRHRGLELVVVVPYWYQWGVCLLQKLDVNCSGGNVKLIETADVFIDNQANFLSDYWNNKYKYLVKIKQIKFLKTF